MKPVKAKTERERDVLFGLVEAYIELAKPIGSNFLKENGFDHLSSATIRNYFSSLEAEGYLEQQHSSGGRIPTEKAFRLYANSCMDQGIIEAPLFEEIETKEVMLLIRKALEELSNLTGTAAFISVPKFDQDFVVDIKVLPLDQTRTLLALMTDFGSVQTEILQTESKLSNFSAKRIEAYLHYRLTSQNKPEEITREEELLANRFYNEAIVRFFVGYSHFTTEEILYTGLSKVLKFPEFHEASKLVEALALFENKVSLRHLLRHTTAHKGLEVWMGSDLIAFGAKSKETAVLAIPYFIHAQSIGAFGILGPTRMPYRKIFGILKAVSHSLSIAITNNLYKFKLTYRQPEPSFLRIEYQPTPLIENKKGHPL